MRLRSLMLALVLLALPPVAQAEEGMWLFNAFPSSAVQKAYGFGPDQAWLDHVRRASVNLGGCSASFVSASGLVMTNHHCVRGCLQDLSGPTRDLSTNGYYAASGDKELRCPRMEASQLESITDVTAELAAATRGLKGPAYNQALKAQMAKLESACGTDPSVRCDVVTLFHGGAYHLYKYRRYQDVRLVFAPDQATALFGGYPDNFNFPRYDFDVSFVRAYTPDGKPARPSDHFAWSAHGPQEGELVFVSGNPGATQREETMAQLDFHRDTELPLVVALDSERQGDLRVFSAQSRESTRIALNSLLGVENGVKARMGRQMALASSPVMERKAAAESTLRAQVAHDPRTQKAQDAWDRLARALEAFRPRFAPYLLEERGYGLQSELFQHARDLVRATAEVQKPNGQRLREYTDAKLPTLRQRLFQPATISKPLEEHALAFSLTKLRDLLGADDPFVVAALGRQSPAQVAHAVVEGTHLDDAKVRERLYNGGAAAVRGSTDPMVQLALKLDPAMRAVREAYEDQVEGPEHEAAERIGRARLVLSGTSGYPDATGTLRLSYGQVKGWAQNGTRVPAMTRFGGMYERATGEPPFRLSPKWVAAKSKLNLATPMNLVTTNDIIGGNSGSPLINRRAEIVGLIFDGNLPSLAGAYWYDEADNRAVAVHSDALLEGLAKVYGAGPLVRELRP